MTWVTPPGGFTTGEIYQHVPPTTDMGNFEVLQQFFGLYGAAGARFVAAGGALPTAGASVQWAGQSKGYQQFVTSLTGGTNGPGAGPYGTSPNQVNYATVLFPKPFPTGGGVLFVALQTRYSWGGYTPRYKAVCLDDSITLTSFDVMIFDQGGNTWAAAGSYSVSFYAVGWTP